ncbi:WYL domain-containing protein [Actinopolymorpha pittospori]|uniref:DNA-binding transcriptional regulator YafY n=1 Tax=Actinopolymorpha pittospori TaxID=648752 RepID=A0A927N2P9_9ACTN|nr:putative DNA-binding transcriptional regulator YafY [Actinopolymorpha pittospori]
MRAERLLQIVLLLQSRGQATAGALARDLDVSTRTIQRDMEALSGAGIPVYSTRGGGGGWSLVDSYRNRLTSLTTTEALSLVVGQTGGVMADLGLDDPGEGPILKLLAAVAPTARDRAEHARQRVHVDRSPWGEAASSDPALPSLQQAVFADHLVRLRYGTSRSTVVLAPLGLVCKGTNWYLVALRGTDYRTYRVARVHDVTVTDQAFERPADFDLASHWRETSVRYASAFPRTVVRLRLRGDAVQRAWWVQARERTIGEPDPDGWVDVELVLEDEDHALGVIRLLGGDDVIVVSPDGLRDQAVRIARAFAEANAIHAGRRAPP